MRTVTLAFIVIFSAAVGAQQPAQPPAQPAAQPPAQSPAQPAPPPQQPPAAKPATPVPPPVETYTYQSEGRRDPFQSLIGMGDTRVSKRGEGPAGLSVSEITVSGVVQSRGELVAMIKGPDTKTYIVHHGDKLADGTIKTITPQGLVIVQEVNDPLSLVKQREIRKLLRSLEDAK